MAANRTQESGRGKIGPMADQPEDNGEQDRRKFERIAVLWSGSLVCEGQTIDCLIVNISPQGAMVRLENPGRCKKSVVLRSPRFGELAGEINWRKGKELGIRFQDSADSVAKKMGKALR